jgi:nucleoside-diphosphate-sugar epimerase
MLARAFAAHAQNARSVCIYAAGVSNSGCLDPAEFQRESRRLRSAMEACVDGEILVYFGTCSAYDAATAGTAYVRHKLAMEELVRQRDAHAIFRFPQLAGTTPNPHTLLNYLYARILRGEKFVAWGHATRNILDVEDAVRIAMDILSNEDPRGRTIDVAAARSVTVREIVETMEEVLGARAVYEVVDKGSDVPIDIAPIRVALARCGVSFDADYLRRVIAKYYAARASRFL